MITRFIYLLIIVSALISCQPKEAYSFNQFIVEKEKYIGHYTDNAIQRFNTFSKYDNYDSLAIVSQQVEELIGKTLLEIEDKEIPPETKGGEDLKKAAIKYFSYMKAVFTTYKELGMQNNYDDRSAARDRLVKILDRNDGEVKSIKAAQRKFISENNLKMK